MPRSLALGLGLLCACSFPAPPTFLPPPFGPDPARPQAARFFYPTGIAIDPSGSWLVVSNSNADRLYDAGAMYSLRIADLDKLAGTVPFPANALGGAAITGNYTGPVVLAGGTTAGTPPLTAYAGSRDTNRLNAVALDAATGLLSCRQPGGAPGGGPDCRGQSIDLKNAQVEGPFGIAAGRIRPPGGSC